MRLAISKRFKQYLVVTWRHAKHDYSDPRPPRYQKALNTNKI